MTTAYQTVTSNYANTKGLLWKDLMERNKIVYLQGRYSKNFIDKILTGETKLRRYSDRNFSTFLYATMEYFRFNRIFARRANTDEEKLFSDLIVINNGQKIYIKLNPVNAPVDLQKLEIIENKQGIFIANNMEQLINYFSKYQSQKAV